jgi:hypothetical protein
MKNRNFFQKIAYGIFHFAFRHNHRKEDFVAMYFRRHSQKGLFPVSSSELFDVQKILDASVDYPVVLHQDNSFYGTEFSLNSYSKHCSPIKACIEHGVYFGSYVNERECLFSGFPALITFSDVRKVHIRTASPIPVIEIGPYIAYADSFLSPSQLTDQKKKMGKTLLVFPSHSTDYAQAKFDSDELIKEIARLKKQENYQTILVNFFWKDIANHQDQLFRDAGFQVTCCGSQSDPFFLRRLKSLILLSDMTMSNSVSTNLGYCIYLGKPHYFFRQKTGLAHSKSTSGEYLAENVRTRELEKEEIVDRFCVFKHEVTPSQYQVCSKYWGFGKVLSPDRLGRLLVFLDAVDQESHQSQKRFYKVFVNKASSLEFKDVQEDLVLSLK